MRLDLIRGVAWLGLLAVASCAAPLPVPGTPCNSDADCPDSATASYYCAAELSPAVCMPGDGPGVVARENRPPFAESALLVARPGDVQSGRLVVLDPDPGQTVSFVGQSDTVGVGVGVSAPCCRRSPRRRPPP